MYNRISTLNRLIIFSLWALFSCNISSHAQELQPLFNHMVSNGGFITTGNGHAIDEYNSTHAFIPASTIKLATSLVALKILGPSYRFRTEFYLHGRTRLYIKGYGDPFLTSEHIETISAALKAEGINKVDEIIIDDSSFALSAPVEGSKNSRNPYDVHNGAVAVNFNSLPIRKYKNNHIVSGESQTPLLPMMIEIGKKLVPGLYRLNVSAFPEKNEVNNTLRYTAELFAALLNAKKIKTGILFRTGKIDSRAQLIYTYTSTKNVSDLVRECLKYSNNFIANQLFLSCGAKIFGYPATWEKGIRAITNSLAVDFGISNTASKIFEGSGLSTRSKVTPTFLLSILTAFKPYAYLLQEQNGILVKSGTLTDVFCYAGYFSTKNTKDPFVIMLNQKENSRKQLLHALHKRYLSNVQQSPKAD